MTGWPEDDRFWHATAPLLFSARRWERAVQEVDLLLELLELAPSASLLDLGCGQGRHALELARRGYRVTGVDRTEEYLDEARRRSQEAGLKVEWVLRDMRRFRRSQSFDAAINLFTTFGYFKDPRDDRRVMANLCTALRPGGRLVMDMIGKEVLARIFRPRDWDRLEDGAIFLEERHVESGWSWIENTWTIVRGQQIEEFHFGHRLYSAAELESLACEVGFEVLGTFGWLDQRPYDHAAERLVLLARRPQEATGRVTQ